MGTCALLAALHALWNFQFDRRRVSITLNDSLADEVIKYINKEKSVTPDRPFFVYYAPGATHAPHHVPKDWIAKFRGIFDQGWDRYREEAYKRQLELGVIPADAKLTPRPKEIPAWNSLNSDQKSRRPPDGDLRSLYRADRLRGRQGARLAA
jgi:arylsulfatase A-like enzyme